MHIEGNTSLTYNEVTVPLLLTSVRNGPITKEQSAKWQPQASRRRGGSRDIVIRFFHLSSRADGCAAATSIFVALALTGLQHCSIESLFRISFATERLPCVMDQSLL